MGELAQAILAGYAGVGLLFAFAFAWRGAAALDPAARGAPLLFRVLILPASAALWPLLAARWRRAARGRAQAVAASAASAAGEAER